MGNPPEKNQRLMIAFMKKVTLPRILKEMEEQKESPKEKEKKVS